MRRVKISSKLQVFVNSLDVALQTSSEERDSNQLVYLLKSKFHLVDEAEIIDINQEIVQAWNHL